MTFEILEDLGRDCLSHLPNQSEPGYEMPGNFSCQMKGHSTTLPAKHCQPHMKVAVEGQVSKGRGKY